MPEAPIEEIVPGLVESSDSRRTARYAQQAPQQQEEGQRGQAGGARGAGQARPGEVVAPLFLKVEWVRPPIQTGQVPMIQENIVDPNMEVKWYGAAAKKLLTTAERLHCTGFTVQYKN